MILKKNDKNHLILNTPAQIRNTLHNNEYTNKDLDIIVDNKLISIKEHRTVSGYRMDNSL